MLSMPVITTEVGRLRAYWRHSSGVTVLLARDMRVPHRFHSQHSDPFRNQDGHEIFLKAAEMTYSVRCILLLPSN
jgi:hypothetical protein